MENKSEKPPIKDTNTKTTVKKKKKKKKRGYASMMADIMKPSSSTTDRQKAHTIALQKNLGGGSFAKMEKI